MSATANVAQFRGHAGWRPKVLKLAQQVMSKYNGQRTGLFVHGNHRRVQVNLDRLRDANRAILETAIMSEQTNKQIVQEIFAGLAKGDGKLFVESMADDFRWILGGAAGKWSKTYAGK